MRGIGTICRLMMQYSSLGVNVVKTQTVRTPAYLIFSVSSEINFSSQRLISVAHYENGSGKNRVHTYSVRPGLGAASQIV